MVLSEETRVLAADNLQLYLTLASTVASAGIFGLMYRLFTISRRSHDAQTKALEAQRAVIEERLRAKDDELGRTHRFHQHEMDRLQRELEHALQKTNLTREDFAQRPHALAVDNEARERVADALNDIAALETSSVSDTVLTADQFKDRGQAALVVGNWQQAAKEFNRYIELEPADWEAHYLIAVASANRRGGPDTDRDALKSISDAITFLPSNVGTNLRARVHTYRAAMLKRLGRLDEALADLEFAWGLASTEYERSDTAYNFACVFALMRDKQQMLHWLNQVPFDHRRRLYESRYFEAFRTDPDFILLTRPDLHLPRTVDRG